MTNARKVWVLAAMPALLAWNPLTAGMKPEHEVRQAVEHYISGDPARYRQVFRPEAVLMWVVDDTLATRPSAAFIAGYRGAPEGLTGRRIQSLDVSGRAAMVKVVQESPRGMVTDYLALLKLGEDWKIVNKTFTVEPRTAD